MIRTLKVNGCEVLIDEDDYELVKQYSWHINPNRKDRKTVRGVVNGKKVYLHRFLLGVTNRDVLIDHINRNPLDNRKSNLRLCTPSQNQYNRGPNKNSTSRYVGVHFCNARKKFVSQICFKRKGTTIGAFDCEVEAPKARDKQAKKLFGEFAYINIKED